MSFTKIKATAKQKEEYKGLYPLHSFLKNEDGLILPVEDLRGGSRWNDESPQWEVMAPKGYVFDMQQTHSLLGGTYQDAVERASCYPLVKCEEENFCSCKEHWAEVEAEGKK